MSAAHVPGVLFLRLEGPLQSWGDNARWVVRPTRLEPTKSGVLGLIAAASGWGLDGEGDRRIAALAQFLLLGVRADREGTVIRDYHTICGGVLSAEGKVKVNQSTREPETVVSERYYLADACFLAALFGPSGMLSEVAAALERPVWPVFLGRKSCLPAAPVWPAWPGCSGIVAAESLECALAAFPWLGRPGAKPPETLRAVVEVVSGEKVIGPVQTRRDVPLSFSGRRFATRRVRELHLAPPPEE